MKGSDLKKIRREMGLLQKDLSRRIGIHWTTLSRYENDALKIPLPVENLVRRIRNDKKTLERIRC